MAILLGGVMSWRARFAILGSIFTGGVSIAVLFGAPLAVEAGHQ